MGRRFRFAACARYAALGCAFLGVYFGGAGAAFTYRQRAAHAAPDRLRLTALSAPTAQTRLMVFAPHCDDETLGGAGLIQQTLRAGGAAQAVMLTNGDGFRAAVERQMRDLRPGPDDYIRFAALRQQESYHALGLLGLKPKDVLFLGYPDRGLMALWDAHWSPARLYTSVCTRRDHSPYANAFRPGARYCGQDVTDDLLTTMRAFRPTLIAVTHPGEDHPDHAAAAAFVAHALQILLADPKDSAWASRSRLVYYLVHRGDWPVPQGARPDDPLLPPVEIAHLDTHWMTLPLTPDETARKLRSIAQYPSQAELMGGFLNAFARRSELFGEIPTPVLPRIADHAQRADTRPEAWAALPPVLLDPLRDNVLRDLQGGGDIRALYACRDRDTLYLRLDTRQPVSRRFEYTLRLRAFGPNGVTANETCAITVRPGDATDGGGVSVAADGRSLAVAIPWRLLTRTGESNGSEPSGPANLSAPSRLSMLALSAETHLAGVEIDKTGVRFLKLSDASSEASAAR